MRCPSPRQNHSSEFAIIDYGVFLMLQADIIICNLHDNFVEIRMAIDERVESRLAKWQEGLNKVGQI